MKGFYVYEEFDKIFIGVPRFHLKWKPTIVWTHCSLPWRTLTSRKNWRYKTDLIFTHNLFEVSKYFRSPSRPFLSDCNHLRVTVLKTLRNGEHIMQVWRTVRGKRAVLVWIWASRWHTGPSYNSSWAGSPLITHIPSAHTLRPSPFVCVWISALNSLCGL